MFAASFQEFYSAVFGKMLDKGGARANACQSDESGHAAECSSSSSSPTGTLITLRPSHFRYPLAHSLAGVACATSWTLNMKALFYHAMYVHYFAHAGILQIHPGVAAITAISSGLAAQGLLSIQRVIDRVEGRLEVTDKGAISLHGAARESGADSKSNSDQVVYRLRLAEYYIIFYLLLGLLPTPLYAIAGSSMKTLLLSMNYTLPFQLMLPGLLGAVATFEEWHPRVLRMMASRTEHNDISASNKIHIDDRKDSCNSKGICDTACSIAEAPSKDSTTTDRATGLTASTASSDSCMSSPDAGAAELSLSGSTASSKSSQLGDAGDAKTGHTAIAAESKTAHTSINSWVEYMNTVFAAAAKEAGTNVSAVLYSGSGGSESSSANSTEVTVSESTKADHHPLIETLRRSYGYVEEYLDTCDGGCTFTFLGVSAIAFDLLTDYSMTRWKGAFFDTFQTRNYPRFLSLLQSFMVIGTSSILTSSYSGYTGALWDLHCREFFVKRFSADAWLQRQAFYRMTLEAQHLSNVDQRLHEDVSAFCLSTRKLVFGLLNAVVRLAVFFPQLVHSAPPGVWQACLLMSLTSSLLTHFIGNNLMAANSAIQNAEAGFRTALIRVRDNAEPLALAHASSGTGERSMSQGSSSRLLGEDVVSRYFQIIKEAVWNCQQTGFRLSSFSAGYGLVSTLLPFMVLAPSYFGGAISIGTMFQIESIIGHVQASLDFFINSYEEVAGWRVTTDRLISMEKFTEESCGASRSVAAQLLEGKGMFYLADGESEEKPGARETQPDSVGKCQTGGFDVEFDWISFGPPMEKSNFATSSPQRRRHSDADSDSISAASPSATLFNSRPSTVCDKNTRRLKSLRFQIDIGENLLVSAPAGAGKSVLLRCLSGVWPRSWARAKAWNRRPHLEDVWFLSQTPTICIDEWLMLTQLKRHITTSNSRNIDERQQTDCDSLVSTALTDAGIQELIPYLDVPDFFSGATSGRPFLSQETQARLSFAQAFLVAVAGEKKFLLLDDFAGGGFGLAMEKVSDLTAKLIDRLDRETQALCFFVRSDNAKASDDSDEKRKFVSLFDRIETIEGMTQS